MLFKTNKTLFSRYFGNDLKLLSKYIAAFWNAVDLRFREINDPKIRLNVAGLVVPLVINNINVKSK